jgi:hypothetical protein
LFSIILTPDSFKKLVELDFIILEFIDWTLFLATLGIVYFLFNFKFDLLW